MKTSRYNRSSDLKTIPKTVRDEKGALGGVVWTQTPVLFSRRFSVQPRLIISKQSVALTAIRVIFFAPFEKLSISVKLTCQRLRVNTRDTSNENNSAVIYTWEVLQYMLPPVLALLEQNTAKLSYLDYRFCRF